MNNGIFNIDENGVLTGLRSTLNVPEGVTKIDGKFHVLYACQFLTKITLPSTCTYITPDFIHACHNKTWNAKFVCYFRCKRAS